MPPLSISSDFFRTFKDTDQQPKDSLQGNEMCSDILGLTGKSHDKTENPCKNAFCFCRTTVHKILHQV